MWLERDTWLLLSSFWEKYQLIFLSHDITGGFNTSVESIGQQFRFDFICIEMRTTGLLNMLIILLLPRIQLKEHNSIHAARYEAMLCYWNTQIIFKMFCIPCQVLYFHTVTPHSLRMSFSVPLGLFPLLWCSIHNHPMLTLPHKRQKCCLLKVFWVYVGTHRCRDVKGSFWFAWARTSLLTNVNQSCRTTVVAFIKQALSRIMQKRWIDGRQWK